MTKRKRRFIQCDVFSAKPLKGNGLAVVVDGDGLSTSQMQQFAAWTNLAETTFLQTPEEPTADYAVRIFTPGREMPFAGHPTLGSCAAWLHSGGVPREAGIVRQQCQIGVVEIDMSGAIPAFVAPPTQIAPLDQADITRLTMALDLSPGQIIGAARLDNGPVWQVLELQSAADVLAIDANRVSWPEFVALGVFGPYPEGGDVDFEVRNLAPSSGMSEDPITGSLNAAIAQWLAANGRLEKKIVMSQGTKIGREGRVYVTADADQIKIGGQVQIVIEGTVDL
ncbi:MAG: PhzF family phenazine biosynthesis protein [Pseudomonadota bacterium]